MIITDDHPHIVQQLAWMLSLPTKDGPPASIVLNSDDSLGDSEAERVEATQPTSLEERRQAAFTVELVPGTNRIVTSVLSPLDGEVLFRIPTWWVDPVAATKATLPRFYA